MSAVPVMVLRTIRLSTHVVMLRKEGQEGGSQAPTHSADSNREQSNNVSWNSSG